MKEILHNIVVVQNIFETDFGCLRTGF